MCDHCVSSISYTSSQWVEEASILSLWKCFDCIFSAYFMMLFSRKKNLIVIYTSWFWIFHQIKQINRALTYVFISESLEILQLYTLFILCLIVFYPVTLITYSGVFKMCFTKYIRAKLVKLSDMWPTPFQNFIVSSLGTSNRV